MSDYIIDQIGAYHQGVAIFSSGKQYGVMLTGGNVLLPPRYDYIAPFNNGYAKAIKGGRCVIIDLSGKEYKAAGEILVPLLSEYDFVRDFHEGLACVRKNYKWGAINLKGEEVISLSYDYLSDFDFGVAKCIKKRDYSQRIYSNDWGFVNSDGEFFDLNSSEPIIGTDGFISFRNNRVFSIDKDGRRNYDQRVHGYIRVDSKGRFALKNGDKTIVLAAQITDYNVVRDFSCGLACVQNKDGYWGVFDTSGNIIVPFEYLSIGDFKENRSVAQNKDGYWGVFDTSGNIIVPFEYLSIGNFKENRSVAQNKDGYWGVFDTSGNIIVPFEYLSIGEFKENRSFAKDKTRAIILLSEEGRIIKKLEKVTDNELFVHGVAIVYRWGSSGLINKVGDLILDFFDGEIIATEDPAIFTLKDARKKVGYFNSSTGLLVNPQYDEIVKIEKDYLVVNVLDVRGCKSTFDGHPFAFNGSTRVLLPDWCVGGEDFQNGICKAQATDKKWGLVDKDGKTVCEPKYEAIQQCSFGFFLKESGKWKTFSKTFSSLGGGMYDRISEIGNGYYLVTVVIEEVWKGCEDRVGVLDSGGNEKIAPIYDSIGDFDKGKLPDGLALISKGTLYGIINKDYDVLLEPQFSEIYDFRDNICAAIKIVNGVSVRGIIDSNGSYSDLSTSTKIEEETEIVAELENGLTIIRTLEKRPYYSIKDSSGKVLLPFKYRGIEQLKNGQYKVYYRYGRDEIRYGILNQNFEEILKPRYAAIKESGMYYIVVDCNLYGVADASGTFLIPCNYRCIKKASDYLFWILGGRKDDKYKLWGLVGDDNELWGLANAKGEFIVAPKYHEVRNFEDGFACVGRGGDLIWDHQDRSYYYCGGHWGVIDSEGNEVLPLIYDSIEYQQSYSLFRVSKTLPHIYSLSGYINTVGERMVKGVNGDFIKSNPFYEWQEDFIDGVSTVCYSGLKGQINEYGQFLVHYQVDEEQKETYLPVGFLWGFDSDNELIIVCKDNKKGLYSIAENRILIEPQYDDLCPLVLHRSADKFYKSVKYLQGDISASHNGNAQRIGLVKENGETLLSQDYLSIETLGHNLISVQREDGQYLVFDTERLTFLPETYDEVYVSKSWDDYRGEERLQGTAIAIVRRNGKCGAINDFGELIIPVEYPSLSLKGNAFLKSNGVLLDYLGRVVVSNGHITVPLIGDYESASLLENNLIVAKQNNLWGVLSLTGQEIVPFIYNSIKEAGTFFIVSRIRLDDETVEYGVIDSRNINIIPFTDVEEIKYDNGLFVIRKGNLYGAYSGKGVLVCDASYDEVEILNDFLIKVSLVSGKKSQKFFENIEV